MEHKVKQRSAEWFSLRKNVVLTASQFADAVGVGKGKPFHFFQSLIKAESSEDDNGGSSNTTDRCLQHGQKMESVIKEAYELLTGLQVQDSGFWVPVADSSMHDLIGASPDGVVVNSADPSRIFGLVEFKAPVYKMYTVKGDIPRQYMIQIQGQMAVCGAPWCDFMAVCAKTREIILKRVFFQPRYWEHVFSRLKQFCFALQEAEIMRELGRNVLSGAMTRRLQQQSMQDKLFPAEDIITVQNLLTRPSPDMFRGPSGKLLSFNILIGETYALPPALNRYGNDLLNKVDAEIRRKSPGKKKCVDVWSAEEREDNRGEACHRVFCEMDLRSPESPERVFGDGVSLFDSSLDSGDAAQPSHLGSPPVQTAAVEKSAVETDVMHTVDSVLGRHQQVSNSGGVVPASVPGSSLNTESTKSKLQSPDPTSSQPSKPSTQSHFRKLSRISTKMVSGNGDTPKSLASDTSVGPAVTRSVMSRGRGLSAGRGQTVGRGQTAGRGQIAGRGQTGGRGQTAGRVLIPGRGQTTGRGQDVGRGQTRGRGQTAGRGQIAGRSTASRGQTIGKGHASGPAAINTSQGPPTAVKAPGTTVTSAGAAVTSVSTAVTSANTTATSAGAAVTSAGKVVTLAGAAVTSASTAVTSAGATATSAGAVVTPSGLSTAASSGKATQPANVEQVQVKLHSARDEWEMSAKGKQLAGSGSKVVSPVATLREAKKGVTGTQAGAGPTVSKSTPAARPGKSGDGHWREESLATGEGFVPPGLSLLQSESSSVTQQSTVQQSVPTTTQHSTPTMQTSAPTTQNSVPTMQHSASTSHPVTESAPAEKNSSGVTTNAAASQQSQPKTSPHNQAHKRPHTAHSSDLVGESKKPLLEQHRSSSEQREPHTLADRNPIHRPWQGHSPGPPPGMARMSDRDLPHFDRPAPAHQGTAESLWSRGRGDMDSGHQWGQHFEERAAPRMQSALDRMDRVGAALDRMDRGGSSLDRMDRGGSALDRMDRGGSALDRMDRGGSALDRMDRGGSALDRMDRAGSQPRIFDYDHQDRIVAEDFHPRRNVALAPSGRPSPVSSTAQFEHMRRIPLDIEQRRIPLDIEQRRLQEVLQRDMFVGSRAGSLTLDGGNTDSSVWRHRQQQLLQQSLWRQQLQSTSQLTGLRTALQGSWPRGQAMRGDGQHSELPSLMDRHYPSAGLDLRMGGSNVDLSGEAARSQFPRGFPPARRPFDY